MDKGTNKRLDKDAYHLFVAELLATRGTCARRKVGCILVDEDGKILATGYNGVARGRVHCITSHCPGASEKSGEGLELCEAIHAEQNALLQCSDVSKIDTVYCTDSPCIHCIKLLMNTGARRIVFIREYPHTRSKGLWVESGSHIEREWVCIDADKLYDIDPAKTTSIVSSRSHVETHTTGSVANVPKY